MPPDTRQANPIGTWSALTPETSQVLICDLQEEIVARSKTMPAESLSQSANVLCQIANVFSLPLTFSVVPEGGKGPTLIEPLRLLAAKENQFLRASASPFFDSSTTERLASLDRRTLVLAGFATEVVVLHAALDGLREGYSVIVAVDACGGMSERTESAALRQIQDTGAAVSSVVSIATALSPDFTTDRGKRMFEILQTLRLA